MFSPIWSHVNENENKIIKNIKFKILKNKYMVDRYLCSHFFDDNSFSGIRENDYGRRKTGGRWTDYGRPRDNSSSDVQ